jgi:signal transduction histidine kinase
VALEAARQATSADEVELFTTAGRRLAAVPGPSPVDHWLAAAEVKSLRPPDVVTVGPVAGGGGRLLSYTSVRSGEDDLVLRLATAAPDLVEDLRERRELLVRHGVAMVLLVVVGVLAAFPARVVSAGTAPREIDAYVAALGRLRDRGEALEEAMQDREAMARAGELTAGMVHEVRNGLGTIVGYARLVEGSSTPAAATDAARRIREECATLEIVVRRFMDFVKRETLNVGAVDLGRMLARVVARESRARPGGEVTLESTDVGPLSGDEDLLERAFENLVRNGREAAGEKGHVWIRAAREAESVVVTVADDGPGIPAETRQSLRPFFTTKAGGLGLGLPIALKIIRLHHGDLVLGERIPRGLLVQVRLPAAGPREWIVTRSSDPVDAAQRSDVGSAT